MSINSRVIAALSGTIQTDIKKPDGNLPAQYCTFSTMSTPDSSAEDKTDTVAHYIYLDLWSTPNYFTMLASIHAAMEAAGFLWQEERAIYEADTNTSHVAMTWLYLEAV
jgi:hypothetical protein